MLFLYPFNFIKVCVDECSLLFHAKSKQIWMKFAIQIDRRLEYRGLLFIQYGEQGITNKPQVEYIT